MAVPPIPPGGGPQPLSGPQSDDKQRAQEIKNGLQEFEDEIRNPSPNSERFAQLIQQLDKLTGG